MENKLTLIIFEEAARLNIPAIILGGLALPAYNVARTTIDIDICIYIESQEILDEFVLALKSKNISTHQKPKLDHDLFTVFGQNNEAEIWLKPCDAFSWDNQMLKNIQKYSANVFVLSLEDFILTKLARADRSSVDIDDILQILINNIENINWDYLKFRLTWKSLESDFKEILQAFKIDLDEKYKPLGKRLLDFFNTEE
ncbi:MAG: DUF6036 family nucleotidyltransferase [Promethearchaeota archaeon]